MPAREYIPVFWGEEEEGWLQGTELEGCADEDRCGYTHKTHGASSSRLCCNPEFCDATAIKPLQLLSA